MLPKLIKSGFIAPFYLAPLRPPFPRWYNANIRCNYHAGNPGRSTKNYSSLKHKVQSLIKDGKLKFEESDGPVGVEDLSRAKMEMRRQEKEASREASSREATMPRDKVPVAKIRKSEAGYLMTIERSKERLCEMNGEEEKKMLQDLVQNLERMLNEQNEYITMLKEEHNGQTLKRRWIPRSGDS